MYFRIHYDEKKGQVQFHTGSDRQAVNQGRSLNHGVRVTGEHIDPSRAAMVMDEWHAEIKLHTLQPA